MLTHFAVSAARTRCEKQVFPLAPLALPGGKTDK